MKYHPNTPPLVISHLGRTGIISIRKDMIEAQKVDFFDNDDKSTRRIQQQTNERQGAKTFQEIASFYPMKRCTLSAILKSNRSKE